MPVSFDRLPVTFSSFASAWIFISSRILANCCNEVQHNAPISANVKWTAQKSKFLVPPDVRFSGENAQNSISAGAPPQTPPGSLQRSPDPLAVFKGSTSKGRGKGRTGEGKGRIREKGKKGKRRSGKGKDLRAWYLQLLQIKFRIRNRRWRPHNTGTACRRHFVTHKNDLNACHQERFLGARYAKIAFATVAPTRTPPGSLQRSPDP